MKDCLYFFVLCRLTMNHGLMAAVDTDHTAEVGGRRLWPTNTGQVRAASLHISFIDTLGLIHSYIGVAMQHRPSILSQPFHVFPLVLVPRWFLFHILWCYKQSVYFCHLTTPRHQRIADLTVNRLRHFGTFQQCVLEMQIQIFSDIFIYFPSKLFVRNTARQMMIFFISRNHRPNT